MTQEQEASQAASGALELGAFRLSTTPLTIGAGLIGAGAVLWLAGMVVSGTVVVTAARRWIDQLEVPPNELARRKWAQARAATMAGASAWQNGSPADTLRS
jgi:hypothetical protein